MSGARTVTVAPDDDAIRLDRWFRRHFPALGHGQLEKLLRTGQVRLDGGRAKASTRIAAGQAIRLPPLVAAAPAGAPPPTPVSDSDAASMRARVLYRSDAVIAIDKPAGLAVQGGSKVRVSVDSLLDALREDGGERPRLVHRLDKDTSGVLVLARTRAAAAALTEAFRRGAISKEYWALVAGVPTPERGRIDLALAKRPVDPAGHERVVAEPADGRHARTFYQVVDQVRNIVSWLSLLPETGRTHQLRVHCRALGTPILGDRKYGPATPPTDDGRPPAERLMLHARRVLLPREAGGPAAITAPLDRAMRAQWAYYGFDADAELDIEKFTAVGPS